MKRRLEVLLAIAMLCVASAALAPAAQAAYSQIGSFAGGGSGPGGSGSKDGQLSNPTQADVSDVTGLLYVLDNGNSRIQAFEPIFSGGRYAFEDGGWEGPIGIAVEPESDDIYIATPGGPWGDRVDKQDSTLTNYLGGWTPPPFTGSITVDPSTGDVLVADQGANLIRRFESDGTPAGSFAAERPLDVAANSSGEIFVVTSTGDLFSCATSSVQRYSASGDPEGTVGASLVAPSAVAVDPDDDSILVAAGTNGYGCASPEPELAVFDADGSLEQSLALGDSQYATVSGLAVQGGESGRAYVVTKSPADDGFGKTQVIALEDDTPVAPVLIAQLAAPGPNDAELRATINPRFAATQYRFEYGLTAAYGSSTPPGSLPAVGEELSVAATIGGLQSDTVYHYRVVAENSVGARVGPDRSFRTEAAPAGADTCANASLRALQDSAYLAGCRAYEMVSPADKNGGSVLWGAGGLPTGGLYLATADGEKVAYNSYQPFPQSETGMGPQSYLSSRTASGWQTAATGSTPLNPNPTTLYRVNVLDATDDFSTTVLQTSATFDPLDQDTFSFPGFSFSGVDVYRRDAEGSVAWLSRPNGDVPAFALTSATYAGRSDDASEIFFQATESLVPEAVPMAENARYLYVRGPAGTDLVNVDESGDLISQCGATLGDASSQGEASQNAVSGDGKRVFFQVPDQDPRSFGTSEPSCLAPPQIYLREGDSVTNVSASQMTVPDPIVDGALFQAASANGSRVFFTSGDRLTDDATVGGGLYAYATDSEELSFLSTGAGGPGGAEVQGVVKSTDDGSHVYFIAQAQLDGSKGTAGEPNLYLWTPGSVRFVATVAKADVPGPASGSSGLLGEEEARQARISADGSLLLFLSRADQTGYEAEGTTQAYLWSEESGTMLCASCDPVGNPPAGTTVSLRSRAGNNDIPAEYNSDSRNLLDDGRVFFETTAALVRRDVNGTTDVYEYVPGGVPHLISDGRARYGSFFFDASADGRDVFFATLASLVSQDFDNGENDIYDARVGGGFFPPPTPPRCAGETCQGAPSSARAGKDIGSATVGGPGSKANGKRLNGTRLLGALSKRVSGTSVAVRTRVGAAGALSASGPGLLSTRKSVKKAGTYTLKLSLDRGAKARLRAKGHLNIRVEVRFTSAGRSAVTRSTTVRFATECGKECTNADGRVQK